MIMKLLKKLLFSFLVIYIFIGVFIFVEQRSFIYFPTNSVEHSGIEKTYVNDSEKIQVISLREGKKNAILYFGGNGEAVEYNLPNFSQILLNHTP